MYTIVRVQCSLRLCQSLTQVTALTSQEIATHVNTQGAAGMAAGNALHSCVLINHYCVTYNIFFIEYTSNSTL